MITDARFQGSNMGGEVPARTDFRGADLTRCYLNFSNLTGCDFSDAVMRGADLTRCNLTGALLIGADLTGANLSYSDFRDADLGYAMLAGAIVNDSDFRGASLRHAELATASLGGVMLSQAVLSQAHLSGRYSRGARTCPRRSVSTRSDTPALRPSISSRCEEVWPTCRRNFWREWGWSGGRSRRSERWRGGELALVGRWELRQDPGHQPRGRIELADLPLQPVQHARLEVELPRAPGADLEVLLDDPRLFRSEPAVEEVVSRRNASSQLVRLSWSCAAPFGLPASRYRLPRRLARAPSEASCAPGAGATVPCRRGTPGFGRSPRSSGLP